MNQKVEAFQPKKEGLEKCVEKAIAEGLRQVEELEPLPFHNVAHTKSVLARYYRIMDFLNRKGLIPEALKRAILIGRISVAFHDTVQDFEEKKIDEEEYTLEGKKNDFFGLSKTRRERGNQGKNEEASAKRAIEYMRELNRQCLGTFTEDDEAQIVENIMVTVPDFDKVLRRLVQKNLSETSTLVAKVLAMSDLGASGMDSVNFKAEGDAVFREDFLDIARAIENYNLGEEIDEKHQAYFKARMIFWCDVQIAFPRQREESIKQEVESIIKDEHIRAEFMAELFGGFDESVKTMEQVKQERTEMNFFALAEDMGYEIKKAS